MNSTLICIVGPTASGKTDLAIHLAKEFQTEIISADSRQIFQEMTIGTAKPTEKQLSEIKHHFINHLSVSEEFNAGMFETQALKILDEVFQKNITPPSLGEGGAGGGYAVLVGGSGLYIKALLEGFDQLPPADEKIREQLNKEFEERGIEYLQSELQKTDPDYFSKVDLKNPHRLIRALEVFRLTGKPYSAFRKEEKQKRNFKTILIGLELPREELNQRINHRVDQMIANGIVEEARKLFPLRHLNALDAVGYKELFEHFEKKISFNEAVELIKHNTRKFAKRQMTWFRRVENIHWFRPGEHDKIISFVREEISH